VGGNRAHQWARIEPIKPTRAHFRRSGGIAPQGNAGEIWGLGPQTLGGPSFPPTGPKSGHANGRHARTSDACQAPLLAQGTFLIRSGNPPHSDPRIEPTKHPSPPAAERGNRAPGQFWGDLGLGPPNVGDPPIFPHRAKEWPRERSHRAHQAHHRRSGGIAPRAHSGETGGLGPQASGTPRFSPTGRKSGHANGRHGGGGDGGDGQATRARPPSRAGSFLNPFGEPSL